MTLKVIVYHSKREEEMTNIINRYNKRAADKFNHSVPVFSSTVKDMTPSTLSDCKNDPLTNLEKATLYQGYIVEIMDLEKFCQLMNLYLDTEEDTWL